MTANVTVPFTKTGGLILDGPGARFEIASV